MIKQLSFTNRDSIRIFYRDLLIQSNHFTRTGNAFTSDTHITFKNIQFQ